MATQTYPTIAPYDVTIRCKCGVEVEMVDSGGGMWHATCSECGAHYTASVIATEAKG